MSGPLTVPPNERGVVRVFSLIIEAGGIKAFKAPGAIDTALGVSGVDTEYVEVFPVTDLAGVGLANYLVDGCGVPEAVIDPDRDRLDALEGHLMVVLSKAFQGRAATITPAGPLVLAGVYAETPVDWSSSGPIKTDSARPGTGHVSPLPPSDATRRVGSAVFVGMLLLIALVLFFLLF
ncbi:MAG: hypothetical protein AB3N23_01400 [Paracoccaceae bacterium]